jgi:hypothetical protein
LAAKASGGTPPTAAGARTRQCGRRAFFTSAARAASRCLNAVNRCGRQSLPNR